MKNIEQYKRLIRAVFCCVLLSIQAGIFLYVWITYYSPMMESPYWRKGHWLILAVYLFLAFLLAKIYDGWRVGYLRVFDIAYSQCLGIIMTNMAMYMIITLLTKHFEDFRMIVFMTLIQFVIISIWSVFSTHIYLKTYPPRKVIMVYGNYPAVGLMKKISTRAERFEVGEIISISEGLEHIEKKVGNFQGVVICDLPSKERNRLLKYCYGKEIRTYTTPKISDLIIRSAESQHMFDTPLLLSRNNGFTIEQRFVKRLSDLLIASLAIIILSPIMLMAAACIKIEDGGSVLYRQKRLTEKGKEFYVFKFRSMREDAEKDGRARLAEENDSRITKVGRIIRAVRIDELPQLFNIIKGEMSIVGPRPERPEIAAEYEKVIPEFAYRLKVKAGLTGYAQVYGKYNTTAYDKLKLDLMYIQNYSIRMDFEIMFKTIQILFMKESTEGIAAGQTTAALENHEKQ